MNGCTSAECEREREREREREKEIEMSIKLLNLPFVSFFYPNLSLKPLRCNAKPRTACHSHSHL